jgi:hypothetical protein
LEPVHIKSTNINTIISYLNDVGINLLSSAVPLGYDYGCVGGITYCEGQYFSFNGFK